VACLRAAQGDTASEEQAGRLLELAHDHLERGRVRLVLVGGLPGTGKSTLAAGISDIREWTLLRSDEVRKDRAGVAHAERVDEPYREGLYSTEQTAGTYAALLARARTALERGESVVLDASWSDARWRSAARAVAEGTGTDLVELRCTTGPHIAQARIAARRRTGGNASDATPAIAAAMAATADPWTTAIPVDTTAEPPETLAVVLRALGEPQGGENRTTVVAGPPALGSVRGVADNRDNRGRGEST